MCKSKTTTPRKLHEIEEESDNESINELFLGEIGSSTNDNELYVTLEMANGCVEFKIDTGAQCNVIPERIFDSLPRKPNLETTTTRLTAYGGTAVPLRGKCQMEVQHKDRKVNADFFIVQVDSSKPLIGLQTCRDLELVKMNVDTIHTPGHEILEEYADVFKGIGLVEGEYHITLRSDAQPTIHPPRKVPLSVMPKLKKTLEQLTQEGVISKVEKATDWVNSLVIVEKKDGSLRLCLDPKELNQSVKREYYKPPTAEEISSKLSGKRIFTVIDMSNCYWHKKLDEESSYLCTFNTPFGRFKFNRMPFGISVASDVAQKMVDEHFSDIPGVLAVHDDIIIAAQNLEEHDQALRSALIRARERNIKFNRGKVQLRVDHVSYLGNIVTADGFKADPDKIKAIIEMPAPQSKQDLQRLLGMVNYLSQYIPNMSEITAPLRSLLKKNSQWVWYHEHSDALEKIKKALTNTPVLRYFDVNKKSTIQADASRDGLGACLMQDGHPCHVCIQIPNTG